MSLTSIQIDMARYKGGDEIKKRKSQLRRTATLIRQLADDVSNMQNALHGVLNDNEIKLLNATGLLVDRAVHTLSADIREAELIRSKYDRAVLAAHKHLSALPASNPDDIVALMAADNAAPGRIEMDMLRTTRWLPDSLREFSRNAITSLSRRCAREGCDPEKFAASIARQMPYLKEAHADVIRVITALAVADEMERAA